MKILSLRPYPGVIYVCETKADVCRQYKKLTRQIYPGGDLDTVMGNYHFLKDENGVICFLVYAREKATLIHEFCHCLFSLFEHVGIDPSAAKAEPFCYMLDQLIEDAGIVCT